MAAQTTAELGKWWRKAARSTALLAGSWVRSGGWLHVRLRCWLGAGYEVEDGCTYDCAAGWELGTRQRMAARSTALLAGREDGRTNDCGAG